MTETRRCAQPCKPTRPKRSMHLIGLLVNATHSRTPCGHLLVRAHVRASNTLFRLSALAAKNRYISEMLAKLACSCACERPSPFTHTYTTRFIFPLWPFVCPILSSMCVWFMLLTNLGPHLRSGVPWSCKFGWRRWWPY